MNSAEATSAAGTTLDALLRRSFRVFADRVAVTSAEPGEQSWTYAELGRRAERLAAGLHATGVRRGDRVAVLSETRPEYVETYAALARLGVTAVTLNVRLHPDELAHCVTTSKPVALIASGAMAGQGRGDPGPLPLGAELVLPRSG